MMAKLCPISGASGFALPACGADSPRGEEDDPECVDEPDKNYCVVFLLTSRFQLHKYPCKLSPVSEWTIQNTGRHSCSAGL
jgi:hypothetical protein